MLNIKSYVNDLEIIYSGHAHIIMGAVLKIDFQQLKMEITFINDEKLDSNKVDWNVEGDKMNIKFINFNNMLGNGILDPWRIGSFQGRELFMTLYSKSVEDDKGLYFICNYIFYLGKEVQNG